MTAALAMEAEQICAVWGIDRFVFTEESGLLNPDLFEQPDWKHLAELAGEPVDMQAWHAWAQERGTSSASAS